MQNAIFRIRPWYTLHISCTINKMGKKCHIECNMFAMGIEGCQVPKLCKKYFINCKPGNYLNSAEQDQKLIMPGESMMHVSIKPDVNVMSDLSQNVRHPQKCNRQMDVPHPNILGWPQKALSDQCRKSQWGDKMISWSYYLHQRILHTGTRVSIAKLCYAIVDGQQKRSWLGSVQWR